MHKNTKITKTFDAYFNIDFSNTTLIHELKKIY